MTGIKHDNDKLRFDLWPVKSLMDVAEVLTYGANKYSDNNWMKVSPFYDRYYAALWRHVLAWKNGEVNDPESGLPHLAHALCCLIFMNEGPGEDNQVSHKCLHCGKPAGFVYHSYNFSRYYCIACVNKESLLYDYKLKAIGGTA